MQTREVEKNPICPPLSSKQILLLTKLCFRPNKSGPSNLLFNFSTGFLPPKLQTIVNRYAQNNFAPILFSGGGKPNYSDNHPYPKTESQLFLDLLPDQIKSAFKMYSEEKSTNFLENVVEALKVLDFSNFKTITYITKSHASGRAYLTLRRFCHHTTIFTQSYPASYRNEKPITKSNWFTFEIGRNRVWGEYQRIKLYGQRGDIEYNEVAKLVSQIESATNA